MLLFLIVLLKDWRDVNPIQVSKGFNIRDFASINELVVLSNLENLNSVFIRNKIEKAERYEQLREIAKIQLGSLNDNDFMKALKKVSDDVYINQTGKRLLK
jgi:hypothetical protein